MRLPNRDPGTTPILYSKRAWIDTYLDEPWYSNGHILLKGEPGQINQDIEIITGVIPYYLTRFTKATPKQNKRLIKPLAEIAYPSDRGPDLTERYIKLDRRNLYINSIYFDNAERLFPGCRLFQNKDSEPLSAIGIEHNKTLIGIVMPISPNKEFLTHAQHLQHQQNKTNTVI